MLYDGNGQVTSESTYLLQGDIIKFPIWLNVLDYMQGIS